MQDSQNQPLRPLNTNHIGNTKDKLFDLTAPGSKALKAASEHRAKIVTFYINGEPFRAGIRVSIVPGKDFHSLTSLYDYLNGKSQVTFGVRYIFTTTGKRVTSIDDLESGSSYVISNNNRFQVMPYGKTDKPKGGDTGYGGQNNGLAPIEGKSVSSTLPFATLPAVLGHSPRSQSLNSKEGKIVTIVNRKDPTLRTRVFLNLRSQRTFELVIKDLGQAVMVKDARRLYTSDGEEIRSISQLRRQLSDFTIFYIESAKNRSNIKPSFIHKQRSNSLESINLQGFKDDELEAIETHRNQDISTDYQFKYPVNSLTSSEQFNPTETETATKLWTPNDNDFKSMENRWSNQEPKSEEVTVKTIATQTSPKLRQPRLRVKRKLGPSKIGKPMLVDKSTENSVKSETESAVEVVKKPNSQPNESKSEKSKKQDKLFTRPNKSGKQSNQNTTKSATNDSSKLNQLTHHDTKRQSTRSSAKSGNSVEPVIFVPISVDDPAIGGDKTNGFDAENRDELKNNQITKENGKMSMMKENAGNESAKAKDYNSLSDEERVKLFSDLIKDKIKLKIENRRKEKKSSEHRSGTSTSFDRGSLASFGDADRLSVLEKIAHEDYMDDHLSLASKSPAQPIDQENLFKGINVPDKNFQLSWIYGYKGNHKSENNLIILDSGELVFFVAAIVVLWNPQNQTQRHYKEHISDIQCMALNEQDKFIATAHENVLSNGSLFSSSEIRVWDSSNLITSAVYDNLSPSTSLISISFTNLGFLLILCYKENVSLIVWDWKNNQEIATINAKLSKDVKLIGAKPLPQGSNIITYGHRHLTFWQLVGSKYNPINLIKPKSKEPILFTCIDFLSNGDFLTGTADGYFTIWSQNPETGLVFRVTDLKGHEASIECIKYLSNNVLVSTDSNGHCISWDIGDLAFKHLNTIMVPQNAGGITSLCLPINTDGNPNFNVYIGTRGNCIAHGSVVSGKEFDVLFEGHSGGLRGITSLSRDTSFFSCGLDSKVCRWGNKKLAWKTLLDVQLLSIAVHPLCQALAIGGVNGVIQILEVESGSLAAQLNVCKAPIVCLAYSPNGNFLAAGAHDGVMYLLPVFDDGFVYEKVSVLKGPHPILSLQWSVDNCFLLTSVNDNNYQELIIWDLPNFRYLTGISSSSENLKWHDATCSGGEDVRGIWDNHNIDDVINVCCHCSNNGKYLVTGDEDGNIRLFSYPCSNPMSAFYARKQGSKGVVEARFISQDSAIVSGNFDGAIFVWNLYDP